jgi:hypothetical protein
MTNDERATIYGRAMLELKECSGNIAALAAYFSDYANRLEHARTAAKRFASSPLAIAPDQVAFSEHVIDDNLRLTRADFGDKVAEMVRLTRRVQELKVQVENF